MKPPELLPYPIIRAFRSEGDLITVRSLRLWLSDYHLEPPQTAMNDNSPDAMPVEWETNLYEYSGDELIAALGEDKRLAKDPEFKKDLPPYSSAMHEERHHRHVRRAVKPIPVRDIDAESETIRYIDAKKMRDWLGADAYVLDMAVEPKTTFADVGRYIGIDADEAKHEVRDVAVTFYERAA